MRRYEAGIPVDLLIDRDSGESIAFSRPEDGVYASTIRHRFGKTVVPPDPVASRGHRGPRVLGPLTAS
ncbi:hypothetical protein [Nocardia sp. NPDC049707]|uniref:hypothetical protein n=1 Tax=Nocardia sp. NPDC049707 TaxID=3154735 RepID=UPI00341718E2